MTKESAKRILIQEIETLSYQIYSLRDYNEDARKELLAVSGDEDLLDKTIHDLCHIACTFMGIYAVLLEKMDDGDTLELYDDYVWKLFPSKKE